MTLCEIKRCLWSSALPTTQSKAEKSSLKNRVFCNWNMIPSLVVLTICVIGILACVYWKSYYLIIPFGIGFLTDLYPIYLSYHWQNLQSFSKNNNEYKKLNRELKTEVETLEKVNQTYKVQNDKFVSNNEKLSQNVSKLEEEKNALASQIQEFAKITTALSAVEMMTKENHELFSASLITLKEQISAFSEKNGELNLGLKKFIRILERIDEWKNAEGETNRRIGQLQKLSETMANMQSAANLRLNDANQRLIITNLAITSKIKEEQQMIENLQSLAAEFEKEKKKLKEIRNAIAKATHALIKETLNLNAATTDLQSVKKEFTKISWELRETAKKISETVEV